MIQIINTIILMWRKRKNKKTLVIMGTHPRTLSLFDWSRTDCDIWLFNEAANAKNEKGEKKYPKCDAVFQMHHEAIWKSPKNRSDPNHHQWLSSGKTPLIYMQDKYPDVPMSARYPIEGVLALVENTRLVVNGEEKKFKYFTSTPDYALALAAHMCKKEKRYERVEIWGIELETESEYVYQRMGLGFWLGYLAALEISLIFNGAIFNEPMYGYEGDVAIPSKEIEKRITELALELGDDKERYAKEAKVFLDSISTLITTDVGDKIEKELNDIIRRNESAGILNGKIMESKRYLEKAKAMENTAGAAVFAPGEFDSSKIDYKRQQVGIQIEANNLNALMRLQLKRLLELGEDLEKRKSAVDEFGKMVADLMNKNMILFHTVGAMQENQFYFDSYKQSFRLAGDM